MTVRRRLVVLAVAIGFACSCRPSAEPSDLPAERLDPAAVLRSAERAAEPSAEPAKARRSSFEERLRRRDGASAAPQPAAEAVALQTIPLGSGLVADLPRRFGDWSWSQEDGLVLALHEAGGGADALLYAQPQAPAPEGGPAAATNRFLYAVEPALASEWLLLATDVAPQAAKLTLGLSLSPRDAARALQALATPTLGRGLGYRSDPGSFTGWRWIGENEHGVYLRLARSDGVWGAQGDLSDATTVLVDNLGPRLPKIADLLSPPATEDIAETAAGMVLASASHEGRTLNLILLCRQVPACTVTSDLSTFLRSLRPSPSDLDTAAGRNQDLRNLAGNSGLQLAVPGDLPAVAEIVQAMQAQE